MALYKVARVTIIPGQQVTSGMRTTVGVFMEQQVKARFQTQGLSGGVRWARKRIDDGRAILTGRTAALLNSFFHVSLFKPSTKTSEITVGSAVKYAKVHQLGTRGKGGILPTIVPKRAKALWIPLNDRAARLGSRSGNPSLVVGKDFIFAKKVDIAPRPMLPTSDDEKRDQAEFVQEIVQNG